MLNTLEYLQWRSTGDLTPWNSRSRISKPFIPDELFMGFELENVCCANEFSSDYTAYLPTTLSIRNTKLTSTSDSGEIFIRNKDDLKTITRFTAHQAAIFDLKWREQNTNGTDNNARNFITASGDRSIVFWDAERFVPISHFNNAHSGSVKTLSFHDANLFASGGRDGTIKLWDLRSSVTALKCGPEFSIEDSHLSKFPTVRKNSRSLQSPRNRQSPIASRAAKSTQNLPSNVVTSVIFKPQFKHHLYSSGVADNSIKMWDIRRCKRQFQCSNQPIALSIHSIKNCFQTTGQLPNVNNHGFRQLSVIQSPKFGNVLLASSSDNRIYVFINNEVDPILAFTGCRASLFTRISLFEDKFFLSGSQDGKVFVWNLYRGLENAFNCENEENILPFYHPTYFFKVGNDHDDITCVAADGESKRFYHVAEDNRLFQWSLYKSKLTEQQRFSIFNGTLPKCQQYVINEQDKNHKVMLMRKDSDILTPKRSRPSPSPLSNWFQTPNQDEPNNKKAKTSCSSVRNSRKQLFLKNRKIKEFFTP